MLNVVGPPGVFLGVRTWAKNPISLAKYHVCVASLAMRLLLRKMSKMGRGVVCLMLWPMEDYDAKLCLGILGPTGRALSLTFELKGCPVLTCKHHIPSERLKHPALPSVVASGLQPSVNSLHNPQDEENVPLMGYAAKVIRASKITARPKSTIEF